MRAPSVACLMLAIAFVGGSAGADVDAISISDASLLNPKLRLLDGGGLLVVAETLDPDGIVFAMGADDGATWNSIQKPLPRGMNTRHGFDGLFVKPGVMCCSGVIGLSEATRDNMPVWTATADSDWEQMRIYRGLPQEPVERRCVSTLLEENASLPRHLAAGYEVIGGEMRARVWESCDWGRCWEQVWPLTGEETSAPVAYLGDVSPGHVSWGWTAEELLFRDGRRTPPFVSVLPERCTAVIDVSAPTDQDVMLFWVRDALFNGPRLLSASRDKADTWEFDISVGHGMCSGGQEVATGDPVGYTDFSDRFCGMVATEIIDGDGERSWHLFRTRDPFDDWEGEPLTGYNVLGLQVTGPKRAYLLANRYNPRTLYCLRWGLSPGSADGNRPPTRPTSVVIKPENPTTNDTLVCKAEGSIDPDGDDVTYTYVWWCNGQIAKERRSFRKLGAKRTKPGETWWCEVIPEDGTDEGGRAESQRVEIREAP